MDFSLTKTAQMLSEKWPDANIYVVRPSRTDGPYSEYDDLLIPGNGVLHLQALLADVFKQTSSLESADLPHTLVAFSKGGVVLNSMMAELATVLAARRGCDGVDQIFDWEAKEAAAHLPSWEPAQRISRLRPKAQSLLSQSDAVLSFFGRVRDVYWLDCHRFPTALAVTSELRRYAHERWDAGLRLRVYGTPQQLANHKKSFVRIEHDQFVHQMSSDDDDDAPTPSAAGGAPPSPACLLEDRNFFTDELPSMLNHFRILREF